MAAAPLAGGSQLSAPLRVGGIAAAGLILVLLFGYWGFPRERLADYLSLRLSQATGSHVTVASAVPSLHLRGPGVTARGVRAARDDGRSLDVEVLVLRPAWSLAWLRGNPAVAIRARGASGEAAGTATFGSAAGFAGDLAGVDLALLPLASLWPGLDADGRAEGRVELRWVEAGPEGSLEILARGGSIRVGPFAPPVPYDELRGEIRLGEGKFAEIEKLTLEGPILTAEVTGYLGEAASLERAPVRLQVKLQAEPALREPLAAGGVRLGPDGSARVLVSGTAGSPIFR